MNEVFKKSMQFEKHYNEKWTTFLPQTYHSLPRGRHSSQFLAQYLSLEIFHAYTCTYTYITWHMHVPF